MKRGEFLKSLASLIALPSLLKDFDVTPSIPDVTQGTLNKSFVSSIELLDKREIYSQMDDISFDEMGKIIKTYKPDEYDRLIKYYQNQ